MKRFYFYIAVSIILCPGLALAQPPGTVTQPPPAGSVTQPPPAGSVTQPSGGSVSVQNPLGDVTITGLLASLLEILRIFAVPIVVFFIIYAGFLYVTARGNVETISKAHRALLYAVIGGVLILGASVLIEVIDNIVKEFKT